MSLEKKMKMGKVYKQTDDDGQQAIRKAHTSFQLRRAKKGIKFAVNIDSCSIFQKPSLFSKRFYDSIKKTNTVVFYLGKIMSKELEENCR